MGFISASSRVVAVTPRYARRTLSALMSFWNETCDARERVQRRAEEEENAERLTEWRIHFSSSRSGKSSRA